MTRSAKNFSPPRLEIKKGRSLHQLSRTVNPEGFAARALTESERRCHVETGVRWRLEGGSGAKFTPLSGYGNAKGGEMQERASCTRPRSAPNALPTRLFQQVTVSATRRQCVGRGGAGIVRGQSKGAWSICENGSENILIGQA